MRIANGQSGKAPGESPTRPTPLPHASRLTHHVSRITHHASRFTPAFTLIELILVMALLTITISLTAPSLSRFFHGRTLDSEARRLLALTRGGQSRAVSEGVPVDLWINPEQGRVGLEAEPGYESNDTRAVEFKIDDRLKIEVPTTASATPLTTSSLATMSRNTVTAIASVPQVKLVHADLPTIRFLPDGTIGDASPQKIELTGEDSGSLWLVQTRDARSYEIRKTDK